MSEEQAADIPPCAHDWFADFDHFICRLCGEEGQDARVALGCPGCGEPPKIERVWIVKCSNYNTCNMHPRVTGSDKLLTISRWNCRSGKDANRWAIYGVDKETGEVTSGD